MRPIDADVLKQHIDKLPALQDGNFAGNHSALKALINMQPTIQPVATDTNVGATISRQAAIDAVHNSYDNILDFTSTGKTVADSIEDIISELPSAQPEPKEGHWIEGGIYRDVIECNCSECGQLMTTAATVRMNYCPRCGARMKEGESNG